MRRPFGGVRVSQPFYWALHAASKVHPVAAILQAVPPSPTTALTCSSTGPLARELGRGNGQKQNGDAGVPGGGFPAVKSPGLVSSEALLESLYNA